MARAALVGSILLVFACTPTPQSKYGSQPGDDSGSTAIPDGGSTPTPDGGGVTPDAGSTSTPDGGGATPDGGTVSNADACSAIAQSATDPEALSDTIACLHSDATEAVKSTAVGTFVQTVDQRGGFPIADGANVDFVYVASYDPSASDHSGALQVAGDFDSWTPSAALTDEGGLADLKLPVADAQRKGSHYKLVTSGGTYFADPLARRFQFDDNGEFSIIEGSDTASHLEWIRDVHATELNNDRPIYLYVPAGYESSTARYPVVYMHDGQNLFDARMPDAAPTSWDADQVADQEISAGNVMPFIIVGIPNDSNRFGEYTMTTDDLGTAQSPQIVGGDGAKYADFIVHDLKPLIDERYRTLPDKANTGILGSSLGGLISYEIGLKYPDVFGKVGGMSSTFDWGSIGQHNQTCLDRYHASTALSPTDGQIFYLDTGGGPQVTSSCPEDNYAVTLQMQQILESKGFKTYPDDPTATHITPPDANIEEYYAPCAPHDESSWNARLYMVLRFFFRIPG